MLYNILLIYILYILYMYTTSLCNAVFNYLSWKDLYILLQDLYSNIYFAFM